MLLIPVDPCSNPLDYFISIAYRFLFVRKTYLINTPCNFYVRVLLCNVSMLRDDVVEKIWWTSVTDILTFIWSNLDNGTTLISFHLMTNWPIKNNLVKLNKVWSNKVDWVMWSWWFIDVIYSLIVPSSFCELAVKRTQ